MAKKRILILGAGLAGLSAAWHLQRKGYNCRVFEKAAEVGGLCRSKRINSFTFYLAPANKSSLYAEVSYSVNKPIDRDNILLRIKEDLKRAGILTSDERICLEDTNDIKYAYPIYDNNYRQSRKKILEFLIQNNVIPCGRYGSWRYMSMEDVILDGKDAAERILNMV